MDAYLDCGARIDKRKSALHLADDPARMLSQLHHTGELLNTKTTYKQTITIISRYHRVYMDAYLDFYTRVIKGEALLGSRTVQVPFSCILYTRC